MKASALPRPEACVFYGIGQFEKRRRGLRIPRAMRVAAATLSCQMIAIPLRASIRKARLSFSVRTEDIETSRRLLLGVAVNLVSSRAEAVDTVAVEIAFPG